ncbi:hypothetical protein ACO1ZD_26905, partial [Klebsiella pneumoniae]
MYVLSVSKKEIGRAGDRLVTQHGLSERYKEEDVQILHEWRMLHLYPLSRIRFYLERDAVSLNKNALLSSRIKR